MNGPLVSICTLAYNHEPYIRQCMEGFLIQKTDFSFEVLIHDDASTDKTADIIKEYEARFPDIIKPIYQSENQFSKGVGVTRVFQFPRVKGKYIAMCEGDDYWIDPFKLQKQVDFLEANNDFVLIGHLSKCIYEGNKEREEIYHTFKKEVLTKKDIIPSYKLQVASVVFRSHVIRDTNILKVCNEHSLFIWLSQFGKFKVLQEVMSVYRIHDNGATANSTPQKAYPAQLKWISDLKDVMGKKFFWGFHFLTAKCHAYYSIKFPDVFHKHIFFKYYYFCKYFCLMLLLYPRNIKSVLRLFPDLLKGKIRT